VASARDHLKVSSSWAMRRNATVLRPSLGDLGRWERFRMPVTAYATPLARVGWHTVWSPCEDVTMRVGGPRVGKTGELACRIVDAPGAVIATSTRTDLVTLTAAIRAQRGPVHLFNPSNLAGWASTIKWSVLVGCRIPGIAQRRAADMIPASNSTEGERWDVQARRVLSMLMHAAALEGVPMQTVLAWVADPGPESKELVVGALARSPEAKTMILAAQQFFGLNERTRTSITATIMPSLAWLTDSRAAAVGDAHDDELLDVRELLAQNGTVFLLGAEDGTTAPLIAALTAEIAWQARMASAGMPAGRLDPPLTIALDEAALVCPVPLDQWAADFGGRGITIHISVQSRSQLRQRWGADGAGTILNLCASIMV
jgi:type IV secretory pathway TraG/TraD family ATPase VirD4